MNNGVFYVESKKNYITSIDKIIKNDVFYNLMKRVFDVIVAFFGCLFLLPLTLCIKIASLLSGDKNKIFFKQERIGKDGKPIYIYKFRSMIVNAEEVLENLLKTNERIKKEYLTNKKIENDPRITKIGKFIRKYSIDEFPQFINVLKGEMSIVGPRPYLYREKDDMGFYYNFIINSKPGITGMWQVNGRSNTEFYKRLILDRKYENEKGIKCDLAIFFKTFSKVLKKEGSK